MERIFQKDEQEQYGPTGQFQKITARIKGGPKADFHGGESAARFNVMATRHGKARNVRIKIKRLSFAFE